MPTSRPVQTSAKLDEILSWYSDIDELKDEMQTWLDNLPSNLQSSDKASQIQDAVNSLEQGHSDLEDACDNLVKMLEKFPDIYEMDIPYTEQKMYKGYQEPRWVRLANPVAAIGAMSDFLRRAIPIEDMGELETEELKQYLTRIDGALDELNSVDFPSMFG